MTMTKTGAGDARRLDSSDARSDATARLFLLFAGTQQPPRGGLADLVRTFDSEEAARTAFRQIRLAESSPASWAQLAAVDGQNRTKPLCWFGIGANPDAKVMALPALAEGAVLADSARQALQPRNSRRRAPDSIAVAYGEGPVTCNSWRWKREPRRSIRTMLNGLRPSVVGAHRH